MIVHFNNTAEAVWYKWHGDRESFEVYLASPHGISDMMEKRQVSPVNVFIEKDNIYISVWQNEEGIEIKDARKNGS